MEAMIHVGVQKDTVVEARAAINDILDADVETAVKISALDTLKHLCQVGHTDIQNCNFTNKDKK